MGGALRMNAPELGSAIPQRGDTCRFMDDLGANLRAGYRRDECRISRLPAAQDLHRAGGDLSGEPSAKEIIAARAKEFSAAGETRKEPSAGCIFKNPSPAVSAGKLIDEAGLKGARVGGSHQFRVFTRIFIINDGTASAGCFAELIEIIRSRVKAARGIEGQTEVEIVGEDVS